jgi:hypothetical protein
LVKSDEEDDVKEGASSLKETSILTSFSGILFAFLLRIATDVPKDFDPFDHFRRLFLINYAKLACTWRGT